MGEDAAQLSPLCASFGNVLGHRHGIAVISQHPASQVFEGGNIGKFSVAGLEHGCALSDLDDLLCECVSCVAALCPCMQNLLALWASCGLAHWKPQSLHCGSIPSSAIVISIPGWQKRKCHQRLNHPPCIVTPQTWTGHCAGACLSCAVMVYALTSGSCSIGGVSMGGSCRLGCWVW